MSIATCTGRLVGLTSGEMDPRRNTPESQRKVYVFFTSKEQTLKALKKAGDIARPIGAGIVVLVAQIVPYPLPLERPPVRLKFIIRRFETIASQYPEKAKVRVYLCRDQLEMLKKTLRPNALVVLGTRRRWWPTREARIARKLRRAGHEVILVETEP